MLPPGGDEGQVLTKTSATDFEAEWIDPPDSGYGGGDLVVEGTLSHDGLVPTSGTAIDQIMTFDLDLTLTEAWQDTGVDLTDLATGTYMVQLTTGSVFVSGAMSWFSGDATDTTDDELPLHRAGPDTANDIFLRTKRFEDGLKLQIAAAHDAGSPSSMTLKARRVI